MQPNTAIVHKLLHWFGSFHVWPAGAVGRLDVGARTKSEKDALVMPCERIKHQTNSIVCCLFYFVFPAVVCSSPSLSHSSSSMWRFSPDSCSFANTRWWVSAFGKMLAWNLRSANFRWTQFHNCLTRSRVSGVGLGPWLCLAGTTAIHSVGQQFCHVKVANGFACARETYAKRTNNVFI